VADAGLRLDGKVAVVTGGASGIGRAAVLRFLDEGACVVAADVDAASGGQLVDEVDATAHKGRVAFRLCDVADEGAVADTMAHAVTTFGRLDCVFNNAGIAPRDAPLVDLDVAQWNTVLNVNLNGVLYGIKHGARAISKNADGGTIINTSSLAAFSAKSGPAAYSASKAAIVNLTMAAAVQLAPSRIRVNAISPGSILTNLVIKLRGPVERLIPVMERTQPWPEHGRPEDIAAAALFLASEDSRFVTGHNLVVDGGLMAAGPRFVDRVAEIQEAIDREASAPAN
jgi:NAD(P)-dependent dehydrogenase (short-subunit alcohol dehydrogenase family)